MTRVRYRVANLLAHLRDQFADLPRRVVLTVQYHGWAALIVRIATFPLRLTPWGRLSTTGSTPWAIARDWYGDEGKPVAIVVTHHGAAAAAIRAIESIKATTRGDRVELIVSDDGSAPEERERLKAFDGVTVVESPSGTTGFAATANRGIDAAGGLDVVLLDSSVIAMPGWLEQLQWAAYRATDIGIVGPKLLNADGTIQSAGSRRDPGASEPFDHRYRLKPADHGPANVPADVLATTRSALYLKRSTIATIGAFDEAVGPDYEDVDLCLRCWDAGLRVRYAPRPTLTHLEPTTHSAEPAPPELQSPGPFWKKWGAWLDERDVRTPSGALRIVYVTEDTGIGGGHRVIFQHLNNLRAHGHDAELWTLEEGGDPDWFDLDVPVRTFPDYEALVDDLEPLDAIKVASWWKTAEPVWRAGVKHGIAVYHVQDIETSYYPGQPEVQNRVMASYRQEFRYMCGSQWIGDRLTELGLEARVITPGIDLGLWHPEPEVEREDDVLLSVGRTNPLKNFPLTVEAWQGVPEDKRPQLWLFGVEPELAEPIGARYFTRPSDAEVNELYNRCTALIQTSRHEGFCLPLIEAMATGAPVICTDSNGNRDFIEDGVNCLVVDHEASSVAEAIERLFTDAELRERLADGGLRTAEDFELRKILDRAEAFFNDVAGTRPRAAGAAPA